MGGREGGGGKRELDKEERREGGGLSMGGREGPAGLSWPWGKWGIYTSGT